MWLYAYVCIVIAQYKQRGQQMNLDGCKRDGIMENMLGLVFIPDFYVLCSSHVFHVTLLWHF